MALVLSVTRTVRSSKNFFRQINFLVCFFYDFDVKYRRKYTGDEKHDDETKETVSEVVIFSLVLLLTLFS